MGMMVAKPVYVGSSGWRRREATARSDVRPSSTRSGRSVAPWPRPCAYRDSMQAWALASITHKGLIAGPSASCMKGAVVLLTGVGRRSGELRSGGRTSAGSTGIVARRASRARCWLDSGNSRGRILNWTGPFIERKSTTAGNEDVFRHGGAGHVLRHDGDMRFVGGFREAIRREPATDHGVVVMLTIRPQFYVSVWGTAAREELSGGVYVDPAPPARRHLPEFQRRHEESRAGWFSGRSSRCSPEYRLDRTHLGPEARLAEGLGPVDRRSWRPGRRNPRPAFYS